MSIATARGWTKKYDDFPKPVAYISGYTRIWDTEEVKRWHAKRVVTAPPSFSKRYELGYNEM